MNNQFPLVSVIVPVYNVQDYIAQCVQSLLKQDYPNIEIILVDDGSPDDCPNIIDNMAESDRRIKVIHKSNGGVSSARNAGIDISSGDYLMFVDADDWVEPDYVSYFFSLAESNSCLVGMNKVNYYINKVESNDTCYVVSAEKAIEWIYSGEVFVAVWNKIYSNRLLKEHNIRFNEDIWYGEGMLFNIEILQYVDTVSIGEKAVYHQTYNPDSAMRKFNLGSNLCGIRSMDLQKTLWQKRTKEIEDEWLYHRYRFNRSIASGLIKSDMVKENKQIYKECMRNLRKNISLPMRMEKNIKAKLGWICFSVCPTIMVKRSMQKIKKAQTNE